MNEPLTIRGLPSALAMDGWWLDGGGNDRSGDSGTRIASGFRPPRLVGLLLLVALSDLLFWRHTPGLSVALFAIALFALAVADLKPRRRLAGPAILLIAAALPVADLLQPLSLAFLSAGFLGALVWAHGPGSTLATLAQAAALFALHLPVAWLTRLDPRRFRFARPLLDRAASGPLSLPHPHRLLRDWAFPVAGCLVFTALLMDANPVLARIAEVDLDLWQAIERVLFWAGVALFAAPFLTPPPATAKTMPKAPSLGVQWLGINAGSVLRGLVMFNLLIGVQSVTDLSILVAGADLPAGMTFAEYAHRGAYPLLATAILAGAFALLARPYLGEHRLIRPLMLLWLGQNMVLCAAAALRLDLYIAAFGLTYLRIYALIWMGLVACGLGLMFWQTMRDRSNAWLTLRTLALGTATLYACSFINFAHMIAAQNVTRSDPDIAYLCALGPLSLGPVVASGYGRPTGDGRVAIGKFEPVPTTGRVPVAGCILPRPEAGGWREWGFRTWAARRYLDAIEHGAPADDHPDRR